jgi:hypothetical protein
MLPGPPTPGSDKAEERNTQILDAGFAKYHSQLLHASSSLGGTQGRRTPLQLALQLHNGGLTS